MIEERLTISAPSGRLRSTALWAPGGIGKTQIALECASRKRAQGIKIIFGVASEDESGAVKSLQKLHRRWLWLVRRAPKVIIRIGFWFCGGCNRSLEAELLLISDNVDDSELLKRLCPSGGCGSVFIASWSESIAVSAVAGSIEVWAFTDEEGGALLRQELGFMNYSPEDIELSTKFSKTLGGHALAIDLMARHMRSNHQNLEQFVNNYEEDSRHLHGYSEHGVSNTYYDKDLKSMWTNAFGLLESGSARLLGILSMLGPDRIPTKIFSDRSDLVSLLGFKLSEFEDIVTELANSAPLKVDKDFQMLSIHRLIQGEFRERMSAADRGREIIEAAVILHKAFPRQKKGSLFSISGSYVKV